MASTRYSVKLAPLGPSNYTTWSILMKSLLELEGLWSAVDPDAAAASQDKDDKGVRDLLDCSVRIAQEV